jgi:hypothetical protein
LTHLTSFILHASGAKLSPTQRTADEPSAMSLLRIARDRNGNRPRGNRVYICAWPDGVSAE